MNAAALLFLAATTLLLAQEADLPARAEAARNDLAGRLMGRLQEVIKTQGPERAIEVCHTEAPGMAEEVGRLRKLRIGRTSTKLRNPSNAAPPWAQAWVQGASAEPQFLETPEGGLRALLPIRLAATCLTCHGPEKGLAPGVRKALREKYSHDQATGYQVGDLRGWFWVEIPGRKAP